jgi:hypothetical protein
MAEYHMESLYGAFIGEFFLPGQVIQVSHDAVFVHLPELAPRETQTRQLLLPSYATDYRQYYQNLRSIIKSPQLIPLDKFRAQGAPANTSIASYQLPIGFQHELFWAQRVYQQQRSFQMQHRCFEGHMPLAFFQPPDNYPEQTLFGAAAIHLTQCSQLPIQTPRTPRVALTSCQELHLQHRRRPSLQASRGCPNI